MPSVLHRCASHRLRKVLEEHGTVGKSALRADLLDRKIGALQQLPRTLDAARKQVCLRRHSRMLFKGTREMRGRVVTFFCQLIQTKRLCAIAIDVCEQLPVNGKGLLSLLCHFSEDHTEEERQTCMQDQFSSN